MNESNDIFQKLGGRKFLVTIAAMAAIVVIAIMRPTALTTELIVGLLGGIATYSGSNAFLTSFAMRGTKQVASDNQPEEPQTLTISKQQDEHTTILIDLQQRMSQNEETTKQIIEIIKQLMAKK